MPEVFNTRIPYFNTHIKIEVPLSNFSGIFQSKVEEYQPGISEAALVKHALDNPIASLPLEKLSEGKNNIVIITSDHTRPVPT